MPIVKNIEKKIKDVEKFDVLIKHPDGRDMRGDKRDIPMYNYTKMAKNAMTVDQWKRQRFNPQYPGFSVDVLNRSREIVNGNTLLSNVRNTYTEK